MASDQIKSGGGNRTPKFAGGSTATGLSSQSQMPKNYTPRGAGQGERPAGRSVIGEK